MAAQAIHHVRPQSDTVFAQPWPLRSWPAVPTRALVCRRDRLFPADFKRRVIGERLEITPDEMDGGTSLPWPVLTIWSNV
ncbi:MAG: hypothetical protein J2P57_24040 [Acidimicrobiaceae bacterium]|nr:hypothetical protein [Acidimicrobiaceae bacterium]